MGDPLIFIRAVHFAATLTLAGALIFAVAVVGPIMRPMERGGEALRARLLRIAWWSFAAALISGVAWLVVLAADISERAPRNGLTESGGGPVSPWKTSVLRSSTRGASSGASREAGYEAVRTEESDAPHVRPRTRLHPGQNSGTPPGDRPAPGSDRARQGRPEEGRGGTGPQTQIRPLS